MADRLNFLLAWNAVAIKLNGFQRKATGEIETDNIASQYTIKMLRLLLQYYVIKFSTSNLLIEFSSLPSAWIFQSSNFALQREREREEKAVLTLRSNKKREQRCLLKFAIDGAERTLRVFRILSQSGNMVKTRRKYTGEERSLNYHPAERVISRSLTSLGSSEFTLLEGSFLPVMIPY